MRMRVRVDKVQIRIDRTLQLDLSGKNRNMLNSYIVRASTGAYLGAMFMVANDNNDVTTSRMLIP